MAENNGSNSTEEVKTAVYALIDGRWNANKWLATEDPADDPPGPGDPSSTSSSSQNYYYSVPLSTSHPPLPNDRASATAAVTLTTAAQWYEYYARRYPSRGFLERMLEQHQQDLEEHERRQQASAEERKKSGGRLLRFFFGWASAEEAADGGAADDGGEREDDSESDIVSTTSVDDHEHLQSSQHEDDGMCGTSSPLASDAIVHEAYAFHRFHLVSERRSICSRDSKLGCWNVILPVRQCAGGRGGGGGEEASPILCIVGYGQIAEFPSLDEATVPIDNGGGANVTLTSDWQHLLSLASQHQNSPDAMPHDLRHCRAASIGRDCLVISWGKGDGWIVVYRRVERQQTKQNHHQHQRGTTTNSNERHLGIGWEVVAVASPSEAVIHAATENMSPDPYLTSSGEEDEASQVLPEHKLYDSGSLYVTDLMPLVANNHASQQQHSNGNQQPHHPPVAPSSAVLAVSRLGGFVELLPLPNWVWQPRSHASTPQQKNLPNLAASPKTTAFSTSQHHLDVMSMDAQRARVEGSSAEFFLAACGQSFSDSSDPPKAEGMEAEAITSLTLWGVVIAHDPDHQQQQEQHSFAEPAFDLKVQRIGHLDLKNTGPDASLFLSNLAADHWLGNSDLHPKGTSRKRKHVSPTVPVCSVTARAPLVSLRFTPSSDRDSRMLLAALDYNGGVSVVDCTDIVRSSEYPKFHLVCDRETTMPITLKRKSPQAEVVARTSQIEWWLQNNECASHHESFTLASYAMMVQTHTAKSHTAVVRLQQWTSQPSEDEEESFAEDPKNVLCLSISGGTTSSTGLLLPMSPSHSCDPEMLLFLQVTVANPSNNKLSICGICKYTEPDEIISTLLRRNNPSIALDIAQKFGMAERFGGRVMNECRIKLWEDQWDTQALINVSDSRYVICQALKLLHHQCGEKEENNTALGDLSLKNLMEIFKEAERRCVDLNESGKDSDPNWLSNASSQLNNAVQRLGTFHLLLNHFTSSANKQITHSFTQRFLCEFQQESLINVASCAAAKGDIEALTVLLVRHPVSSQVCMKLLDLIPLGIDVSAYEHLLPCCVPAGRDLCFLPKSSSRFLNHKQLFIYFSDMQLQAQKCTAEYGEEATPSFNVYMDDADRDHVLLHFRKSIDSNSPALPKDEVSGWFLQRALSLHKQTGQVLMMKKIVEAGLIRLNFVSFAADGGYNTNNISDFRGENLSSSVGKMIYLYSAAALFGNVLLDKLEEPFSDYHWSSSILSEWLDKLVNLSVIQFCSMELSDVVPFILENNNNTTSNDISAFQKYIVRFVNGECLQPIDTTISIDTTSTISLRQSEDLSSRLVTQGLSFCLDTVKQLQKEKKCTLQGLEVSLSLCADFASFSVQSHRCILQSKDVIIKFAENLFYSVLEVVKGEWDLMTERVINKLWTVFELLPFCTAQNKSSETSLFSLSSNRKNHQAKLYFRLAVVQLCRKWRGQGVIPPRELWNFLCCKEENNSAAEDICIAGQHLITLMCRGFCDTVARGHVASDNIGHLFDFISDIDEFDKRFFSSGVQLSGCLGKFLLSPLLSQHSFIVLKNMLKVRSSWFFQDYTCSVVLSFIRRAAAQDGKLHVAMACYEHLQDYFKTLQDSSVASQGIATKFEYEKRLLDARQFMSEAMKLDQTLLGELFSINHPDDSVTLLQVLLEMNPNILLLGCEFWRDESSASNACTDASIYFTSQIYTSLNGGLAEGSSNELPPMPGSLFMQLANILGLRSPPEIILVKQYMVSTALKANLGSAAVAICYSMLCDIALLMHEHPSYDATLTSQKVLDCVVTIIANQIFSNMHTKKDICTVAMRLFSTKYASRYHILLDTHKHLEYECLSLDTPSISPGVRQLSPSEEEPHQSDSLVFKAAELVARQARDFVDNSIETTLTECESNFDEQNMTRVFRECDLFRLLDLDGSSASRESIAFTKSIFNWVLSEAFRARSSSHSRFLPIANILMMTELGSSCLTGLLGHDTASLVINQTLADFNAKMIQETNNCPRHPVQPDASIVQRLNDRGYGLNSARRAVAMTNNQGYSAALNWAMSHFQDDDFDSPIYFIQASDDFACTDKSLIGMTGELISSVKRNTEDRRSTDTACRDLSTKAGGNSSSHNGKHASRGLSAQSTPKNDSRTDPSRPPNSADSTSSVGSWRSLSSRASVKKQVQHGKTKLGTHKLSQEERKKLAIQGRQLLVASRSKNIRVLAPPTTITTSKRASS